MSLIPRNYPPTLIPNSGTYFWGPRIRQLPINLAQAPIESQKLFIEALKSTEKFSFRILRGKEEWVKANWHAVEKIIPKGHWTEAAFILIDLAGKVVVVALAAMAYARL